VVKFYSRRKSPPPKILRYDIPPDIRTRILTVFQDHSYEPHGGFSKLLEDVGKALFKQYGGLSRSMYEAARRSNHPVIEHFFSCDDKYALDFIEACFQQPVYNGGQKGVDEINEIFLESGIGYELTPLVEHSVETRWLGRLRPAIETEFPRVIRRDDQLVHQEIIEPMLNLLTDSRLRVANTEMLKALTVLRQGDFEDAITLAGSSFESLLKTICDIKKWPYDQDHDTCSKLVDICQAHGLFPAFYGQIFKAVGTVRNKLSDAHGRGPAPQHQVSKEFADHMIHMTSSHMLLIAKLAGLS
jgi:hypothetical protein